MRHFIVSQNLVLIQTNFPIVQNIHRKTGSHQITNIISNIDFRLIWKTSKITFFCGPFPWFSHRYEKVKKSTFFQKMSKRFKLWISKNTNFSTQMWRMDRLFLLKNFKKLVFRNESKFWRVSKKRQKSSFFRIEFPMVHKKVVKKRLFPNHPYQIEKWF